MLEGPGAGRGTVKQDLRPIHGILSAHRRIQAETWSCLVCDSSQPWSQETCSICKRDHIPPWLLDVNERPILPGSLVRCPSDSVRYAIQPLTPASSLRPSSNGLGAATSPISNGRPTTPPMVQTAISTPPRTAGARASASSRTPPVSPGRIAGVVGRMRVSTKHSSSRSPSPSARSVTRTETNYRSDGGGSSPANSWSPRRSKGVSAQSPSPKVSKIGGNSTSSGATPAADHRQKRGREEPVLEDANAALKAKFEAQPEATRTVMVTAVHGVRPQPPRAGRSLEGYCVLEGDDGEAVSRALVKIVLEMKTTPSVEVVDPGLEREEYEKFLTFGLCGRCERIFRIDQGWKHVSPKCRHETMAEGEIKLRNLTELEAKIETRKAALRAARAAHADVIEATERLKAIRKEMTAVRRAIEPLIMSCPFCLWNCAPLFTSPTSAGEGQACRLAPV